MARVTRQQIRDAVIFRADLPTNEPRRVSDDQLNALINRSWLRLQGILQSFHSEDYFTVLYNVTLSAMQGALSSSGMPKILHIYWKIAANQGVDSPSLLRLNVTTEDDMQRRGGVDRAWSKSDPPTWRFMNDGSIDPELPPATTDFDQFIEFTPIPSEDERLVITMQPEMSFTDDTVTREIFYAWEEWIVLDCLLAIRQRDKQDAGDIFQERERTELRIREQAPERRKDEAVTVLDREFDAVGIRRFTDG